MPINSKRKGASGERELSKKLTELGYKSRRGQQYCGADGSPDVIGLDGIHIECKRTEALRLYDALTQAQHDKRDGELPAVFHRRSRSEWLVIMTLEDWINLYREWANGQEVGD
jgi:Holliday junction resolvase